MYVIVFIIEGSRGKAVHPKIKSWKLLEMHKNKVKNTHSILACCPKIGFLKHILNIFPGKLGFCELDEFTSKV